MKKAANKGTLFQSIVYSFSQYFRIGFKIVGAIIVAKILGPANYGLRNAFDIAVMYESNSDLGTFHAMNREVPYNRGIGNDRNADLILSNVFSVNLIVSLLFGGLLIVGSLFLSRLDIDSRYIEFVKYFGLIIITNKIKLFFFNRLKSKDNFILLSKSEFIYGLLVAVLSISLAFLYNLSGVLLGLVISDIAVILYLILCGEEIPALNIDKRTIFKLVKIGFPVMSFWLLLTVLRSTDRILIVSMISEESLGIFSVATVAAGVIAIIPTAIYSVMLPKLVQQDKVGGQPHNISQYMEKVALITSVSLPVLIAVIYFNVHMPINYYLTKYLEATAIVKILVYGYFFSIFTIPISVCFSLNKQNALIFLIIPGILLNLVINYLMIRNGFGLRGVAIGTNISYAISCAIIFYFTLAQFEIGFLEIVRSISFIFMPLLITFCIIYFIDLNINHNINTFWMDASTSLLKTIAFVLLYSLYLFVTFLIKKRELGSLWAQIVVK